MTVAPPSRLWLFASKLLTAVEEAFTQAAILLPTRRLVYGGQQYPDDVDGPDTVPGALVVGLVRVAQGLPGLPAAGSMRPPAQYLAATYQIELHRPASSLLQDLILPSDEAMQIDALNFMQDASVLHDAFMQRMRREVVPAGQPMVLDTISPLPVQGGSSGTYAQVTVSTFGPF